MPKIKIFIKDKEIFFKKLQYMASNNLNWHVNYDLTPNWAKVVPPSGSGNANVSVSAIPASSLSETDLTGEIVIESDNGQEVRISVERCIKCETSTTISYGYVEKNFEACDTSSGKTANVPYSSITINEDCTSSVTTSESSVTFNNLSGRNCSASSRSQIIKIGNKNIAKGTQAGGCGDIECFGPCECTPRYAQVTPYPSVAGTGGTVTITWNGSYQNCDNPRCSAFTVNERVEVPCNSGAARTYSGSSTSYGTWRVSQASGTPSDCGICTYTCTDFLNFSGHTVPANPTSAVEIFSFEKMKKSSGGKKNGTAWYPDSHNFLLGTIQPGDWDSETHTEELSDRWRFHVYLPANRIGQNTNTSQRTDIMYIRAYHCSDNTYSGKEGVTGMPSSVACTTVQMTIKQEAAAQTCNVTNISVANSSIELTGSSFSNKVTVSSNGNACTNQWYGYNVDTPNVRVTGNSGSNYTGTTTGTYRVHSDDDPTKTATFTVTAPVTGVVLNITVNAARDNDGHAYPWLMMNGAVPQEAYQGIWVLMQSV